MGRKHSTQHKGKTESPPARILAVLRSRRSSSKADKDSVRDCLEVSKSLNLSFRDEAPPLPRLFSNEALASVSRESPTPIILDSKSHRRLQPRTAMSLSRLSCEFKPALPSMSPPPSLQRLKPRNYSPYCYPKLLSVRESDSYYPIGGGKLRSLKERGKREARILPVFIQQRDEPYKPFLSRRQLPPRVISVLSPAVDKVSVGRAGFLQEIVQREVDDRDALSIRRSYLS